MRVWVRHEGYDTEDEYEATSIRIPFAEGKVTINSDGVVIEQWETQPTTPSGEPTTRERNP